LRALALALSVMALRWLGPQQTCAAAASNYLISWHVAVPESSSAQFYMYQTLIVCC
jgi:hypothetical protein